VFAGCASGDPRETNFAYVNENIELLEAFPWWELDKFGRWSREYQSFVKQHLGKDTIVEYVDVYDGGVVQFSTGGSGLSVGSVYFGFYYCESDRPFAFEFGGFSVLEEIEPGVFYWEDVERRTRNIRTEKIRDNWYYYLQEWR